MKKNDFNKIMQNNLNEDYSKYQNYYRDVYGLGDYNSKKAKLENDRREKKEKEEHEKIINIYADAIDNITEMYNKKLDALRDQSKRMEAQIRTKYDLNKPGLTEKEKEEITVDLLHDLKEFYTRLKSAMAIIRNRYKYEIKRINARPTFSKSDIKNELIDRDLYLDTDDEDKLIKRLADFDVTEMSIDDLLSQKIFLNKMGLSQDEKELIFGTNLATITSVPFIKEAADAYREARIAAKQANDAVNNVAKLEKDVATKGTGGIALANAKTTSNALKA